MVEAFPVHVGHLGGEPAAPPPRKRPQKLAMMELSPMMNIMSKPLRASRERRRPVAEDSLFDISNLFFYIQVVSVLRQAQQPQRIVL